MDKHSKHHDSSAAASARDALRMPPPSSFKPNLDRNPLVKYQGCKWDQVFDFDKILKQIRNAERYYLRGKPDQIGSGGGGGGGSTQRINAGGSTQQSFPRRERPQVQRLNSTDMHFYGMVPKQQFDVVVCDKCLGSYTKMGFNNHMKLHHPQDWNLISSKSSKDSSESDIYEEAAAAAATVNILTEQPTPTPSTSSSSASSSSSSSLRHKSSKSSGTSGGSGGGGGGGGSSRSRSKSKHHHHHQQQQQRSSSAAAAASASAQASSSRAEVSAGSGGTSSKSSKKVNERKKDPYANLPPVPLFSSQTSQSTKVAATASKAAAADVSASQQEIVYPPTVKEKTKTSKRKSKASPISLPSPDTNDSSNSSAEFNVSETTSTAKAATSTPSKSTSKRSKSKGGKDLKQLQIEPPPPQQQMTELDKAISSITEIQSDDINETSNSSDNDFNRSMASTPIASPVGYSTEEASSVSMKAQSLSASTKASRPTASKQQQQQQMLQMLPDSDIQQQQQQQLQLQQQQQRTTNAGDADSDNSILTLEDMLDSKFIHAILNTDESEIHFDESELDKAAQQQQQQQQAYLQPTVSKRMRYDDQIGNGMANVVENVVVGGQQSVLSGKYAAFQQQQQQQQTQQAFHVTNLEDIKMYTTAIDAQQYLAAQQQQQQQQQSLQQHEQHQITTIDPMQLQQLLYQQQQQQQQQHAYAAVGAGLIDEVAATLEQHQQQQQQYNESADVIMCSAEQLHKEGKINAADYAALAALAAANSNNHTSSAYGDAIHAAATSTAAQFSVYNIPSLTDDDDDGNGGMMAENKMNDVIIPQQQHHHQYVLPAGAGANDEEQLIYEITGNNQVAVISQQRQQQMIAEFLTQAGYDNVDNGMNVNQAPQVGGTIITDHHLNESKNSIATDYGDAAAANMNELMDFDFSRIETVKSCGSSSSSSSSTVKIERNSSSKLISPNNIPDDLLVNVYVYPGLPRPMAINNFGLYKLPQGVATTFRKTLHATRKANNSPISLSGNAGAGGAAPVTTRFGSNVSHSKTATGTAASSSYFTSLGSAANANNTVNEFSIGSITITNQSPHHQNQNPNNSSLLIPPPPHHQHPHQHQQQQQMAQKQSLMIQTTGNEYIGVNGMIAASAISPSVAMHAQRSMVRPKSGSASAGSSSNQSKQKYGSHHSSSSSSSTLIFPQNAAKTIVVNANNIDQTKCIKRSMISKMHLPTRNFTNLSSKQLSDMILHPSKDKHMQLLGTRDAIDKETGGINGEHRLHNVRQFYERRKRLLNTSSTSSSSSSSLPLPLPSSISLISPGFNQRQLNSNNQSQPIAVNGLKQKFLRQRLLRTLSDCSIDSIKNSNNNSANNSSSNDILRVS